MNVVLLCSDCRLTERLVTDWPQSGTTIDAVVVATSGRRRRPATHVDRMRSITSRVVQVQYPVDWTDLSARLGPEPSPLLVCYGFMRRIPDEFLQRFALGGLNFHPALLPDYPGPHPTRCMVADRALRGSCGMTLHRIRAQFDRGEVLGQSRFLPSDYGSVAGYEQVAAATMLAMLRDLVPRFAEGRLPTWPQPAHTGNWAVHGPRCVLIGPRWTRDEAAAALAFLPQARGLLLPGPRPVVHRIVSLAAVLGPPTGAPARCRPHCIDFDSADARLRVVREGRAGRLYARWLAIRDRLRPPVPPSPLVRPWGAPVWAPGD